jgi:hypothetical protein
LGLKNKIGIGLLIITFILAIFCTYFTVKEDIMYDDSPRLMEIVADTAASAKWRNALTGGGDALDGISYSGINDGDVTFVLIMDGTTAEFYVYVFDDDSGASESSPEIIEPDDAGGSNGRWILAEMYAAAVVGSAADGDRYINVGNSTAPTSPSDGDCYYNTADNDWCCYNTSSGLFECVSLD